MAILPVGIGPQEGGYQIERSLRFNSADSAYLSRTPASAGNRKTWTFSFWAKRSGLSADKIVLSAGTVGSTDIDIFFTSDQLMISDRSGWNAKTTQVFRDVSAWYHFLVVLDTTQATNTNRIKMYVNGVQITDFASPTYPSQDATSSINNNVPHYIGTRGINDNYWNGYLTEINFIDGSALDPTSFGEYNSDTGVWQPKAYTGSYGTNGFYLDFADNSSTTALGYDAAGSNDWTPNNFSVTAGAGNDSLVDTPTPYGTDTGVGGEVRGNYCTLNPLRNASQNTLANGNLDVTMTDGTNSRTSFSTIGLTSGKWYWEALVTEVSDTTYYPGFGVNTDLSFAPSGQSGDTASGFMYLKNGQKFNASTLTSYGASYTNNDVIGVALDMDAGTITFYKNGSSQGQAFSGITGTAVPCAIGAKGTANVSASLNFGQRPFAYTAPSGFKSLCTTNLPEPTILDGGDYFNTVLWTGADTSTSRSITGVGFQPDLTWVKSRSAAYGHTIYDAVRGAGSDKMLSSDGTASEAGGNAGTYGYISSFDADGFTGTRGSAGSGANPDGYAYYDQSGATYVAWNWKAGGTGVSNTAGSIASTVSANTTAGFSIVTYTGNATSGATVGHGLGVAPSMVIVKSRSSGSTGWYVYHTSVGNTKALLLNSTIAPDTFTGYWNNTTPSSTVFTLGDGTDTNASGGNFVAYCFAPVAGYSAFGSYTGNGSTDGPFVYTGFRPKFVLIKCSSAGSTNWVMLDVERTTYNVGSGEYLLANDSGAEGTGINVDILSNGFKLRNTGSWANSSGATYIYAAFAETPFSLSLAR